MMSDRGQLYGDGFYETMLMINGRVPLIEFNYRRILLTALKLQIDLPKELSDLKKFESSLEQFANIAPNVRIRMNVVRNSGGFYLPLDNSSFTNFIAAIAVNPLNELQFITEKVNFADSVTVFSKGLSRFKTLAKPEQVLLALENQARNYDDLIALNEKEEVAECIFSNINFITVDGLHVTPSLESGCLAGSMRAFLIANQKKLNIHINEVAISKKDISEFIGCYTTNALSGITPIKYIKDKYFDPTVSLDLSVRVRDLILSTYI